MEAIGLIKFEDAISSSIKTSYCIVCDKDIIQPCTNDPCGVSFKIVPSQRPVEWSYLKRDFDQLAEDIKTSHNPDAMREAIKNIKYLIEELGK